MMDPRLSAYGSFFGGKPMPMQLAQAQDMTFMKPMPMQRRTPALPVLAGCVFVPWLLFAATFWLRSFELRHDSASFANVLCFCLLVPVVAFAWMTSNMARSDVVWAADAKPMAFLTVTSLLAWVAGIFLGDWDYNSFMRPYYDIKNLNVYPSVDPSKYTGQQLMDAGMIQFTPGSTIRLDKSMGFKNDQVYCVAPIVANAKANQSTYDFWAVGMNCCSGHLPDFKCGEFSNPAARWGLRLMDDRERDMFRLAVKEAEATFNLKAPHPVFMYWLTDPTAEVDAYQDDGLSYFLMLTFCFFAVQLFLVLCGACFASRQTAWSATPYY